MGFKELDLFILLKSVIEKNKYRYSHDCVATKY